MFNILSKFLINDDEEEITNSNINKDKIDLENSIEEYKEYKENDLEEFDSIKYKKHIQINPQNEYIPSPKYLPTPDIYRNRSSSASQNTPIRNNFQRITEKPYSTDVYFNNKDFMNSIALDILCIYIKGQKTLYTEAKTYCEQQLNFLMLPAIFISSITSVLSFVFNNQFYGAIIISSLSAFNAFLLSLISYLKLDAKSQAHKTSA